MKKVLVVLLAVILAVACAFTLVACNKNKGKQPSTPDTPTACEHVYGEWIVDTEATCTTNGAKHKTCTKCGDVVDEVITATGHVYGEWIVDTAATLNAAGAKHKICSACENRVNEVIPQLSVAGKSYVFDNVRVEYSTATADDFASAKISKSFSGTDEEFVAYLLEEYGLDNLMICSTFIFNDDTSVVTQSASDGVMIMSMDYECSVTGDYAITALAMNFIVTNNNQIELTFVSFCDDKINVQYIFVDEDIEKEECEHVYGKWTTDTEATCVTNGTKHRNCVKCGNRDDDVIPATSVHDYSVTGKCQNCSSDLGRTIIWEEILLGNWYIHLAPTGSKIYINFTTIYGQPFYFDLEAQQYFEDGITEDDFDKNLVKEVKLYKDGDFDNEIELYDNDCVGENYFQWYTVDSLDADTKYYLVLTLDQEYDEFILYFAGIEKENNDTFEPVITTECNCKIYDGEPFVVEATSGYGEISVIYFNDDEDFSTGSYTPPTEPGSYYAVIYSQNEAVYDYDRYYFEIIENPKTISVGENYGLNYDAPVGTEFQTKVEVEGGKEYVLYVNELDWEYEVSDDTSTYEFVFDDNHYYRFTAKKDGFITITGTRVKDDGNLYYVGVFDIIEIEDASVDNIVTLAPSGSQIFKVSTEDAPYLNFNLYDVFDKFYISCFDPDMNFVDDGITFNESIRIRPDLTYDYYYIEVYSCNEEETQQFNFKSLPIIAEDITETGYTYIDATEDEADTHYYVKVYLEDNKEYIITLDRDNIGVWLLDVGLNDLREMTNGTISFVCSESGYYFFNGIKYSSGEAYFQIWVNEVIVMTNPYDSDNANNKVTLAPDAGAFFKFELNAPAPIKLNGTVSGYYTDADIANEIVPVIRTSDLDHPYFFNKVGGSLITYYYYPNPGDVDVLPAGTYYLSFGNNFETEKEFNMYFVCMHNEYADCLTDYGVCLNCGAFAGHKLLVDSSIYPTIGAVGDKEYYFIENMAVGNYHIDEDSDGHESVEYSVYDEEGNAVEEGLVSGENFDVTVAGKYYVVVERVNDEDDSIGFEIQFQG